MFVRVRKCVRRSRAGVQTSVEEGDDAGTLGETRASRTSLLHYRSWARHSSSAGK
jgi:hypothetical protein